MCIMIFMQKQNLAIHTGRSVQVEKCQGCGFEKLTPVIFLGYLPPVNKLVKRGSFPSEQPSYPAQLLYCPKCHLAQLGLIVDPEILFPKEYPYTSGTTKVLRDNFADLYKESSKLLNLKGEDLIVDIGSNDGTLLSNFKENHRVLGVTPEDMGKLAVKNGIPTIIDYFSKNVVKEIIKKYGKARLVTAANVFAHMEDIDNVIDSVKLLLDKDGVFISESHYLLPLVQTLQYDTIYHEHMRYYSLVSIKNLLEKHELEVFHVKEIPSHGGSIRVYAARAGFRKADKSVLMQLKKEKGSVTGVKAFKNFAREVSSSKLELMKVFSKIKRGNKTVFGISAPSRASTLINYSGIDEQMIEAVVEVEGSYKIGNYIPGTIIPIENEALLFRKQPDYALLLSWHIANELMPKLKAKGFKGDFIIPLPKPKIIKNKDV